MMEASVSSGARNQKVVFRCTTNDSWPVVVAGDASALGNWDVDDALAMQPQTRPQGGTEWSAQAELPLGSTVEYKFVKKTDAGIRWESGNNHRYTVIPGLYTLLNAFRE